jgi:hypothetical protein
MTAMPRLEAPRNFFRTVDTGASARGRDGRACEAGESFAH